jgi:hypothetical protein
MKEGAAQASQGAYCRFVGHLPLDSTITRRLAGRWELPKHLFESFPLLLRPHSSHGC